MNAAAYRSHGKGKEEILYIVVVICINLLYNIKVKEFAIFRGFHRL